MNRLILAAELVERGATRYTPAGLPALDLSLMHTSEVLEDKLPRKVVLTMRAVAIGEITRQVAALPLGQVATYAGFIAPSRNAKGLVFHVTAVDASPPSSPSSS